MRGRRRGRAARPGAVAHRRARSVPCPNYRGHSVEPVGGLASGLMTTDSPDAWASASASGRAEAIAAAAVDLTVELVGLDTVNPALVPGAPGEAVAVELLAARL